jgi:hypothetical protein
VKRVTYKHGLIIGVVLGICLYAFAQGWLVVTAAPWLSELIAIGIAVILTFASVLIGAMSAWNGHAVLTTTGDGAVYGCTALFDVIYFVGSLIQGRLPSPFSITIIIFQQYSAL